MPRKHAAGRSSRKAVSLRVGGRVYWRGLFNKVPARIIEDRGNIGVGGRRLYRIQVRDTGSADRTFEVPAQELTPIAKK